MLPASINNLLPASEVPQGKMSRERVRAATVPKQAEPVYPDSIQAAGSDIRQIDLDKMVEELKRLTERMAAELSFSIDRDLSRVVVTVTDSATKEVIRKIPPEELIELAKMLREMEARGDLKGILVGMEG